MMLLQIVFSHNGLWVSVLKRQCALFNTGEVHLISPNKTRKAEEKKTWQEDAAQKKKKFICESDQQDKCLSKEKQWLKSAQN